jgi:hypothetical protein
MAPQFWQTTIRTSTGAVDVGKLVAGARWQVIEWTSTSHWARKRPQAGQAVMCLPNRKRSTSALEISRVHVSAMAIAAPLVVSFASP